MSVTTEIGNDGRLVMVEPETHPNLTRRVFRYIGDALEYATLPDWRENNSRARWYGFASRELPPSMTN